MMRRRQTPISLRYRKRVKFGTAISLSLIACCITIIPISIALAQALPQTNPPNPAVARSINQAGYSLKPVGLAVNDWPVARADFSIEKDDHTRFDGLTIADLTAKLDGRSIPIKEGDLKTTSNDPTSVLLMIDGSGSMVTSSAAGNKLNAAKKAIRAFIDSLGQDDSAALYGFDESPYLISPLTANKTVLKNAIDRFEIRNYRSLYTALYSAIQYALQEAKNRQIPNVIVLSDGMEDTPLSRSRSYKALAAYKRTQEQQIADFSRDTGTRVFTIAIGDKNGSGLAYVDYDALSNVSRGANGGSSAYIDLPRLKREAGSSEELYQANLVKELNQTYSKIRESFHYNYSLALRPGQGLKQDNDLHKLSIACAVGSNHQVQLVMEFTYTWLPGTRLPDVKPWYTLTAILIPRPAITVENVWLAEVYLAILAVLAALAVIPSISRRIKKGAAIQRLTHAIDAVGPHSPLIGQQCGNEGAEAGRRYFIKPGDVVIVCPKCNTPHHLDCWQLSKGQCYNRICQYQIDIPSDLLAQYGLEEQRKSQSA